MKFKKRSNVRNVEAEIIIHFHLFCQALTAYRALQSAAPPLYLMKSGHYYKSPAHQRKRRFSRKANLSCIP